MLAALLCFSAKLSAFMIPVPQLPGWRVWKDALRLLSSCDKTQAQIHQSLCSCKEGSFGKQRVMHRSGTKRTRQAARGGNAQWCWYSRSPPLVSELLSPA